MPRVKSDEEYLMMKEKAKLDDYEDEELEEEFEEYEPYGNPFRTIEGGGEYFKGIKRRKKENSEPINVEKPPVEEEESGPDIELELKVVEDKQPEPEIEGEMEAEKAEKPEKSPKMVSKKEKKVLYTDDINNLAEFFKVYSDSTRLKIIHLLSLKEISVSEIAEALDITQSATSHQLKILRTHRLVKSRKEAKQVFYSLNDSHIVEILNAGITHMNEQ